MPGPTVRRRIDFNRLVVDEVAEDVTCTICRESLCPSFTCGRSQMQLKCCDGPMCCKCACELAKRCTCDDECENIIVFCPYCRNVSKLDPMDLFLGMNSKIKTPCKTCESMENADEVIVIGGISGSFRTVVTTENSPASDDA